MLRLGVVLSLAATAEADQAREYEFDIPRQSVETALSTLATQTGALLLFPYDLVQPVDSKPVSGKYTVEDALAVLLQGTGLTGGLTEGGVITISRAGAIDSQRGTTMTQDHNKSKGSRATTKQKGFLGLLALVFSAAVGAQDASDVDQEEVEIDEIVVTGTNIRGAADGSSPLIAIDRAVIDDSGYSTISQVLAALPQNFGGGSNEDTSEVSNAAFGSGINLRGLGADATLTLINGRRLPAAGADANFTDISSIPLSAVERIEVLADGASAIYGTDAVAGVVNIILKTDFDGAESSIRYGFADSDFDEVTASQIFGRNWSTGSALLTYEYYQRGNLRSRDRDFTATSDLTSLGGDDFTLLETNSNPGNLLNPLTGELAAIPGNQDGTNLTPSDILVGEVNFQNHRERTDVLPRQERHALYFNANQHLSDAVTLHVEGRYTNREFDNNRQADSSPAILIPNNHPNFVDPFGSPLPFSIVAYSFVNDLGPVVVTGDVETLAGVAGSTFSMAGDWEIDVFGTYTDETIDQSQLNAVNLARLNEATGFADVDPSFDPGTDGFFNPFADGAATPANVLEYMRGSSNSVIESSVWSFNAIADGALYELPAGSVKMAFGTLYRDESFETSNTLDRFAISPADPFGSTLGREVTSAFSELLVPLVGDRNSLPFFQRLEVSLAGRYEDYSDFGDTTNPKVGVVYSPFTGLILRASFGTSFRAPNLTQLDPISSRSVISGQIPDQQGIPVNVLVIQGDGEDLAPETAETFSLSLGYSPEWLSGLSFEATYFEIDFEDRISAPGSLLSILIQEDIYTSIIDRDFDLSEAEALFNDPMYFGGTVATPADVEVIIDAREQNLSRTQVTGVDFSAGFLFDSDIGQWDLSLSGSYLIDFREAITPLSPLVEFVDTVNNPVDLRIRWGAGWSSGPWASNIFVNYADGYTDPISSPERSIDSLTTIDLRVAYQIAESSSLLSGTTLALIVSNLLNEDPPFVNNLSGVGYDPANGDPVGRFAALQVTKRW